MQVQHGTFVRQTSRDHSFSTYTKFSEKLLFLGKTLKLGGLYTKHLTKLIYPTND